MTTPENPSRSPLDRLAEQYGLVMNDKDQEELMRRLNQRAIDEAEDDQPASQPYDSESSHVAWRRRTIVRGLGL